MPARTLRNLIIASGRAGVAGQSFRNDVKPFGAGGIPGAGAKMSDYIVDGWEWDTFGSPPPIGEQTGYDSGTVFPMTFTFLDRPLASYIRRVGSSVISVSESVDHGLGASMSATTSVTTSTSGSVSLTMISRFNPLAQIDSVTSGMTSYPDPFTAPDGPQEIQFVAATATGPGSDMENRTVNLHYEVDIGGFNTPLDKQYIIKMKDRAAATSDFEIQWSNTGTENTTTMGGRGTGTSKTRMQVTQGETTIIYYRYRYIGDTAWMSGDVNGWHIASFDDPRAET